MHILSITGAGIAWSVKCLGHGLDELGVEVRFPVGARDFSLLRNVHTGSGPTQSPINGYGGKAEGA
jgi:hypothetical protein